MSTLQTIPTLTTPRLILRAPHLDDFGTLSEFFGSERAKFVGGPVDAERSWRGLATELGHWQLLGYGRWSVERRDTGEMVALVGLWNPHGWPEPEIGWDVMNGHEGNGYATEAATAARDYAYGTLGWPTMISLIAPANDPSKAVARRLGAGFEKHWTHERFGEVEIWRHPSAEDLSAGGVEAYA